MSDVIIGQRWSLKASPFGTERSYWSVRAIAGGIVTLVHVLNGRVFHTPRRNLERGMRSARLVTNPDGTDVEYKPAARKSRATPKARGAVAMIDAGASRMAAAERYSVSEPTIRRWILEVKAADGNGANEGEVAE